MPKQAMGVYSGIRFIPEAELGVTPTTGTVRSIPFNSCTVSAEQNRTTPGTMTGRRDPVEPIMGNINVGGGITVPLDTNVFGWILALAFGNPTTTSLTGGKYQHVFKPSTEQPSFSLEQAFSNGDYFVDKGCKISSLGFSFGGDGELTCDVQVLGCNETISDKPISDSVTELTLDRLNNFQAALKVDNADVAVATEFTLDVGFGLDEEGYAIGGGGFRSRINEGLLELSGKMTAFYDDDTYIQKAMASAITALQVKLTKQGNSLQIDLPEVQFPRRSPNIEGSSGIMQELEYGAFYKTNALNTSIQFTLINETASYEVVSA